MTFPNSLIALHNVWDLYACVLVVAIGLMGAGMIGYGLGLKRVNRR